MDETGTAQPRRLVQQEMFVSEPACTSCGCRQAAADKTRCERCLEHARRWYKEKTQRRVAAGLCGWCGLKPIREGLRSCGECGNYAKRKRKYLTSQQRMSLIQQYRDGASIKSLCDEFRMKASGVRGVLRKSGTPLRDGPAYNWKLTEELADDIIRRIGGGDSIGDVLVAIGVSQATFWDWRRKGKSGRDALCVSLVARIDEFLQGASFHSLSSRVHQLDESYFRDIDSEDKAWMLGFIATDGNVSGNRLSIKLAEKDRGMLERIKSLLHSDAPITWLPAKTKGPIVAGREILGGPSVSFTACSMRLVADLARHGIMPNKTFTVRPWGGPSHLVPSYWRGAIDGDGTVCTCRNSKKPNRRPQWSVSLVGNRHMAEGFRDFARTLTGRSGHIHHRGNIFSTAFRGNAVAREIVRCLYDGASIALPRKMELAARCLRETAKT